MSLKNKIPKIDFLPFDFSKNIKFKFLNKYPPNG